MNTLLRYISISHKTASAAQREQYYISEEEKSNLVAHIKDTFHDITGLFILATCNRTEIYFESLSTQATMLRDFLIELKATSTIQVNKQLFEYSNTTENTIKQLLTVSSGLTSSVLGDAEVIHQVKKAYQFSIAHHLQGSLLERAMQTIFKNHKRVSNETHFRDGTTSIAYRSLKVIENTFSKAAAKSKKILFIGAGDIVTQLFKYNSKFNFTNIYVSNRTEERANALAHHNQCKVYPWKSILANDLQDFDVIISAVSNAPRLIKKVSDSSKKMLLIDLAMPGNIDAAVAEGTTNILYNLDTISVELKNNKIARTAAIEKVEKIIKEELYTYLKWLHNAPIRESLATYKKRVDQKIIAYGLADAGTTSIKMITDQIMRKLQKQKEIGLPLNVIDAVINEHISLMKETIV